jgi:hypothetical protein
MTLYLLNTEYKHLNNHPLMERMKNFTHAGQAREAFDEIFKHQSS